MERKNNLLIGLTFYLETEEQPFDRFNFLFGEFSDSFFLSFLALKFRELINKFCLGNL